MIQPAEHCHLRVNVKKGRLSATNKTQGKKMNDAQELNRYGMRKRYV